MWRMLLMRIATVRLNNTNVYKSGKIIKFYRNYGISI